MIKEIKQTVGMHNKFHLVLTDAETGKVKQEGWAYNVMLDKCIERVRNQFTKQEYTNSGFRNVMLDNQTHNYFVGDCRIGGYMHLGTGTGTIDRARTEMFTFLDANTTVKHDNYKDLANRTGWYTQKATWLQDEIQNVSITEVGLAAGTDAGHLNTHALVEDSEGSPISINKGENDILTVYAIVYVSVGSPMEGDNFKLVNGSYGNYLLALFIHNGCTSDYFSNNHREQRQYINFGTNDDPVDISDSWVKSEFYDDSYHEGPCTAIDSRSCYFEISVPAANGNHARGIRELGVSMTLYSDESGTTSREVPMFRAVFPIPGIWPGFPMTDEQVATGDGSAKKFNLKWENPTQDSVVMKLDGVGQTEGVDYTVSYDDTDQGDMSDIYPIAYGGGWDSTDIDRVTDGATNDSAHSDTVAHPYMTIGDGVGDITLTIFRFYKSGDSDLDRCPKEWTLEGSNNGSDWITVLDITESVAVENVWISHDLDYVTYKYWKFTIISSFDADNTWTAIDEVDFHYYKPMIEFTNAPGAGVAITADYEVPYIPKDENYLIKFRVVLSFKDDGEVPTAVSLSPSTLTSATGSVTLTLGSIIDGLSTGNIVIRKNSNTVLTDTVSYTLDGMDTAAPSITFTETADIQSDDALTVLIRKSGFTVNGDSPATIPISFS